MKWINVQTRLPDQSGEVLLYFKNMGLTCISVEWYSASKDEFLPVNDSVKKLNIPTHWMPIPKPPTEEVDVIQGIIDQKRDD